MTPVEQAEWQKVRAELLARVSADFLSEEQRIAYLLIALRSSECPDECTFRFERRDIRSDPLGCLVDVIHTAGNGAETRHTNSEFEACPAIWPPFATEMARIGREIAPLHAHAEG